MRGALSAYQSTQTVSLDGEQAFAELYGRLGRWCEEIINAERESNQAERDAKISKSIDLLSAMDSLIDVSRNQAVATRIMVLHRFAIKKLVEAKAGSSGKALAGLDGMLMEMGEIFQIMHEKRTAQGDRESPTRPL